MPPIQSISGFSDYSQSSALPKEDKKRKEQSVSNGKELSEKEQRQVRLLEKIDADVKAHEAAHQAAAGGLARGKSFGYTVGPDGRRYAISGEVKIDTSVVPNNPSATIAKMQIVRRAALAPGDSSGQDRSVAAQAAKAEAAARQQLTETKQSEPKSETEQSSSSRRGENGTQNRKNEQLTKTYTQQSPSSTFSYQEMCSGCGTLSSCNHLAAGLSEISGYIA